METMVGAVENKSACMEKEVAYLELIYGQAGMAMGMLQGTASLEEEHYAASRNNCPL